MAWNVYNTLGYISISLKWNLYNIKELNTFYFIFYYYIIILYFLI